MSSNSIHTRTDVLTGRQVILATQRSKRPIQVAVQSSDVDRANDPFLQGQERSTPQERLALRHSNSVTDSEGWLLRVVPNRYPAAGDARDADDDADDDLFARSSLIGIHEVVIECPDHRTQLTQLSAAEVTRILAAWQIRHRQLVNEGRFGFLNIFRNEGFGAGASLSHCHSQILATNLSTSAMQTRLAAEQNFQLRNSGTLFQHWLKTELDDESRIVGETPALVVVCPFASRMSWQIRISPNDERLHKFGRLSMNDLSELAAALLSVLNALAKFGSETAFNITLTMPPLDCQNAFPWMLDVLPRTGRIAGFELMTDVDILTFSPEESAQLYRRAVNWQDPCDIAEICPENFEWR